MSRVLALGARALAVVLVALCAVLVVLCVGVWWWSGTDGSLAWTLQQAARWQPLHASGVSGSLRSGLQLQQLVWERDGVRVEASNVQIEWNPLSLLAHELSIRQFTAASVQVSHRATAGGPPPRPPQSLDPGLDLSVDKIAIGRLRWEGATTHEASALAGDYLFAGTHHQLRIAAVTVASGRYHGQATVDAQAPLRVDASLNGTVTTAIPGSTTTVPLAFTATLRGPMARLEAAGRVGVAAGVASPPAATTPAATVTAVITPWEPQPLPQARALMRAIDLHAFWGQAPHTQLAGEVSVAPAGAGAWSLHADLSNSQAGPWDAERLPVEQLQAEGEWRGDVALVRQLHARLGGGSLQAQGRWSRATGWTGDGMLRDVDPAALHSKLAAIPVSGDVSARQEGRAIAFELALLADGKPRKTSSAAGRSALLELRQLAAQGTWDAGVLALPSLRVRTSDAVLSGSVTVTPKDRSGAGKLALEAPGLRANAQGELAQLRGGGSLKVDATDLAAAQRWLQRWPFAPAVLGAWRAGGQATLDARWQGGWKDPQLQASLAAPRLTLQSASVAADTGMPWLLRDMRATANGRLSDAAVKMHARGEQGARQLVLDLAGRGGASGTDWRARIASLQLALQDPALGAGSWRLALRESVEARWHLARFEVDAGRADLIAPPRAGTAPSQALLAWEPVRLGGGELHSAGRLTGLPMAWIELLGGPQLAGFPLSGDLLFDALWDAQLGAGMQVDASLSRSAGDISVLVDNAEGASTRVAAGVREARLTLQGRDGAVNAALAWDSERAGHASGSMQTRLERGGPGGWRWPADARLNGRLQAQLPRLGVWSLLAPPGWRLRGSLAAEVLVSGARSDPQFSGTVRADDLSLRSVVDGVEFRNGWLRARLEGQRFVVDEFVLHGAGAGGGGSLVAKGEGSWLAGVPQLQASVELTRLRASIRSDRELTVSGHLGATMTPKGGAIRGDLTVDQARIAIPDETPPRLGADVVVRNARGLSATAEQRAEKKPDAGPPRRPLDVAVKVDLGRDFRVTGRGIDTRLAGTLALSGVSLTTPRLEGTIRAVDGEYRAYGQRLDIERGVLRFTGAVNNPALDILAVRPRLEQRVGVLVTGTAQAPFVRLYSEPDLPDAEKLSWLVVGRASASGGAESALLEQAALALLASRRGGANSGGIAGRFGLDELSVHRDDTAGAVVTLGKRFARDFYASYETSLGGALGTLNIFYDISRRLTLRARTGETTAVELIYTFRFD